MKSQRLTLTSGAPSICQFGVGRQKFVWGAKNISRASRASKSLAPHPTQNPVAAPGEQLLTRNQFVLFKNSSNGLRNIYNAIIPVRILIFCVYVCMFLKLLSNGGLLAT